MNDKVFLLYRTCRLGVDELLAAYFDPMKGAVRLKNEAVKKDPEFLPPPIERPATYGFENGGDYWEVREMEVER